MRERERERENCGLHKFHMAIEEVERCRFRKVRKLETLLFKFIINTNLIT